ncbi:MAG: bifunctional homocysteine S-methyltransferase/methylenetetrahydrofolate reductase, partial [Spirochaetota bacterium]|nr:bifunctional homocysteine S-methyltransferase/methylenetetrahydrofolate reductase [Spirochaetota bacterium]
LSTPEYFATYSKTFVQMGVRIVGGCCGTTPEHIREMRSAIRSVVPVRKDVEIIDYKLEMPEIKTIPAENKSKFARKIINKEFVTTIEITPPRGCDPSKVLQSAELLKEKGIDAINIPDGPRASSRMSAMIMAQIIEQQVGIETIMHYTCRDRNLLGMQSDLLGASAVGLRNILIITGDPPKMGDVAHATAVFDVDAIGLTRIVNNFNHGLDIVKNPIGKPTAYFIGVGVNPGAVELNIELERFHKKVEAGAEFAITQPVFDVEILLGFLEKVKHLNIPILAGIWPLVSYRNAEFMNNEVPGVHVPSSIMERMKKAPSNDAAKEEGIKIANETFLSVKNKIQGAQVSAPFGRVEYALQVLGID